MSDFKIGDFVFHGQRKCEIIADRKTPYHQLPLGDIFPSGGAEFVVSQHFTEQDRTNNITFLPYLHLVSQEMRHADTPR